MPDPTTEALTQSLLAGLAAESADPDAADAAGLARVARVGPEDYLIPPDDEDDGDDDDGPPGGMPSRNPRNPLASLMDAADTFASG